MCQYPVKITNIQVDITFIIAKLIDEVPSHAKGIVTLVPNEERVPTHVRIGIFSASFYTHNIL
jgi:hypothetical protein